MMTRSSAFTVLLLTQSSDLQGQLKHDLKDATVIVAKDVASLPRPKRAFDAVLLDAKRAASNEWADVQRSVDLSQTVIIAGSGEMLRQAAVVVNTIRSNGHLPGAADKVCLEHYIESKLAEFVKGMKSTAGRDLYAILMAAVERPLITFALKETNGNQLKAAHLLGMNRNTLRKKIGELRIAVKRERSRRAATPA